MWKPSNIECFACGNRNWWENVQKKLFKTIIYSLLFFELYYVINPCTNTKIKMPVKTVKTDKSSD